MSRPKRKFWQMFRSVAHLSAGNKKNGEKKNIYWKIRTIGSRCEKSSICFLMEVGIWYFRSFF